MLKINKIRDNKNAYLTLLQLRGMDARSLFDSVIKLDDKRKFTQQKLDDLLSKGNQFSSQIGELFKNGKQKEANDLKEKSLIIDEITRSES